MFYRKYRPQTISELDNSRIRETLGAALLENNWGQAYLFIGPRGTGKTSAARILAKIVNCENRKKGEEPCNKCDTCKAITLGSSLDVIEIDAASNTGVEDIRDLRSKVRLAPTSFKYKVYIIDEVHMLSNSAFNALLKTLEEPPTHVIFVLATTDPQKLPETIVSRCLVYDFGKVTPAEIISSLGRVVEGEKLKIKEEVLIAVAAQSTGSFRDAHKLLEQITMSSASMDLAHLDALNVNIFNKTAETLLKLMLDRNKKKSLELIEEFCKDDDSKLKALINSLLTLLRNILLFKNNIGDFAVDIKINDEETKQLVSAFTEAGTMMRDCPVPQLPLELVVVEFCDSLRHPELVSGSVQMLKQVQHDTHDTKLDWWQKVLEKVGMQNKNLVALLRASRPGEIKGDNLSLEVFYKFHKEKLEEPKNREILEKAISDIMKKDLKVKFELTNKIKS